MAVLRMSGTTISKNWNIWQMQDVSGKEQLAVRLNGESKSLEFTFTGLDGGRQTVVFGPLGFLFDARWHRVLLEVSRRSVALFVDCVPVGVRNTPPRQKASLDGFTLIGKLKDNPVMAVPVRPPTRSSHTFRATKSPRESDHHPGEDVMSCWSFYQCDIFSGI